MGESNRKEILDIRQNKRKRVKKKKAKKDMEKKEEEEDTEEEKKWVDAIKELRSQDKYMGCKRIYNALCQRDDFPFNKWSLKNFLYKKNLMIYATKPRSKLDTISKVKRRDKICFSWIDTGECRYGDLCKFFHGKKKNTK